VLRCVGLCLPAAWCWRALLSLAGCACVCARVCCQSPRQRIVLWGDVLKHIRKEARALVCFSWPFSLCSLLHSFTLSSAHNVCFTSLDSPCSAEQQTNYRSLNSIKMYFTPELPGLACCFSLHTGVREMGTFCHRSRKGSCRKVTKKAEGAGKRKSSPRYPPCLLSQPCPTARLLRRPPSWAMWRGRQAARWELSLPSPPNHGARGSAVQGS